MLIVINNNKRNKNKKLKLSASAEVDADDKSLASKFIVDAKNTLSMSTLKVDADNML
jgi:hypothetical protein